VTQSSRSERSGVTEGRAGCGREEGELSGLETAQGDHNRIALEQTLLGLYHDPGASVLVRRASFHSLHNM